MLNDLKAKVKTIEYTVNVDVKEFQTKMKDEFDEATGRLTGYIDKS